ncbi:T9SS type A sorting domain-containing protein [Candidatus Eisenbacteria bacterium]|uniref:T9SS type A sorting domain-containing protein n=1 Tax=Eiseniibacteriota bacterium TaxID=2212470 RepID=A0ABV6YJS0_UNCEI
MRRIVAICVSVLLCLAFSSGATAQTIEYVSSTLWSGAFDVEVVGDYAYCAFANGLGILDVSDPTNPVFVSQVDLHFHGESYSGGPVIDVEGDFAYIANGDPGDEACIHILDISNPFNPELAGSYGIPGKVSDIVVSDHYAYVCWSGLPSYENNRLQIIDVADPSNPTFVGSYDNLDRPNGVFISGDYAYVSDWWRGLQILDISDPSDPTHVGSYAQGCGSVVVSGSYAYVAGAPGFLVIDVSEPTDPILAGSYELWGGGQIFISDGHAYVTWGGGMYPGFYGLDIVHIGDPTNPTLAARHEMGRTAPGRIFVSGRYTYLPVSTGIMILDYSSTSVGGPALAGDYFSTDAKEIALSSDYAYIAGEAPGLHVVNVSDPTAPMVAGDCEISGYVDDIAVSGRHVYLAEGLNGLGIVDVSDPGNPTLAGSHDTPSSAHGVFVSGSHAYVVGEYLGLQIIDVSDPSITNLVGSCHVPGARHVFVSGDYTYAAGSYGVHIIDVLDLSAPAPVASLDMPGVAQGIFVTDGFAYVIWGEGSSDNRMTIFAVADPSNPVAVGSFHLYMYPSYDVFVADGYAYLATSALGLLVVDVSDPANPTLATWFDTRGGSRGVSVAGSHAYVADGHSLLILRFDPQAGLEEDASIPGSHRLLRAHPNPCINSTTIRYGSGLTSEGVIDICDIQGRVVRSFAAIRSGGLLTWDGTDASGRRVTPGVYFVRLNDGRQAQAERVTLVR